MEKQQQQHKQKHQRITQLPGENGLHARDGSLMKKKQEQWAQEKADAEQHRWFPFGGKTFFGRKTAKRAAAEKAEAERAEAKLKEETNARRASDDGGHDSAKNAAPINFNNSHNSSASSYNSPPPHSSTQMVDNRPSFPADAGNAFIINGGGSSTFNYSIPPTPTPLNLNGPPPHPLPGFVCPSPFMPTTPLYMDYSTHHLQTAYPPLYPLSNLIPISSTPTAHQFYSSDSYPIQMPISVTGPSTTFLEPIYLPQKMPVPPFNLLPTPPFSGSSSSDSANSPPKEVPRHQEENEADRQKQQANLRWQQELDRQVAERRQAEEAEAQMRMREEAERQREEEEEARKEEEWRAAEERRRTKKIEIRDQHEQACLDSIQMAQKEAELLRRAKLFRHILQDGEADLETAKKVLKADEDQLVRHILKQLRDLELQRRIATASTGNNKGSSPTGKSPKLKGTSPRAKDTMAINDSSSRKESPLGNFSRANTWNVKQSRTIPNQSFLPVPVRNKLQGKCQTPVQKDQAKMGTPRMATFTPKLASTMTPKMASTMTPKIVTTSNGGLGPRRGDKSANSSPIFIASKPPTPAQKTSSPAAGQMKGNQQQRKCLEDNSKHGTEKAGLFEQLNLRRPRLLLPAFARNSNNNNHSQMTLLNNKDHHDLNGNGPQQNVTNLAINDDEAIGVGQHGEKGENVLEENGQSDNHNGNGTLLLSSSNSASSISPTQTTASSSIGSASVVKFRALLNSPFGSEDDLSADLAPLPPQPRICPMRNGGGPLMVPQSPFSSRKTSTVDPNGNRDYLFGDQEARRSLRSPTMRRLRDSIQSLATTVADGGTGSVNGDEGPSDSRSSTPKQFNCRTGLYRSFNLRRETTRQKKILEHLATVRAQLKDSQAHLEKTMSKQNLAASPEGSSNANYGQGSSNNNDDVFL